MTPAVGMQVALYRAAAGNWLDGAINAFSGFGGYSHAELVFSDGISFTSTSRGDDGSCIYADGRPKKDGTRFKFIDYSLNPQRWTRVDVDLGRAAESYVFAWCVGELDARYDFAGCARFVLPFWGQHKSQWFCSEIVVAALMHGGLLRGAVPHKTSPNQLAKRLGVR